MTSRIRPLAAIPAAMMLALLGLSCAGPTRFLDPEADLAYYERVAVAPFSSLAQDQLAGQKMADVFFAELLRTRFAQVVEPGQLLAAMLRVRGNMPVTNPWSTEDIAKLGAEVQVQGIFMGTVREYTLERIGRDSYPHISLETRLVDTASGRLVWGGSRTRRGGPGFPILGFGETHTLGELSAKICRELLSQLPRGK